MGVGGTAEDARAFLDRSDVDVVLLDVRIEGGNGLQLLSERGHTPPPYVLVLSSFHSSQYVAAAARFGASGFLLKSTPLPELLEAIETVASGGTVFTASQLGSPFVTLTPRERAVVGLVVEGLTNKEIGDRLGTSNKAVELHLSGVFARHGISGGRVELALRALSEGWLEIDPPADSRRRTRGSGS